MSPKLVRSALLMLIDVGIVTLVPFIALLIRFEGILSVRYFNQMVDYLPAIILIRLGSFYLFGLYRRLWRYASINDLLAIMGAVTVSSLLIAFYIQSINTGFPRSIHILSWMLAIVFIGGSRLLIRVWSYVLWQYRQNSEEISNVIIIGAGDAGAMIAREIRQRYYDKKRLVGFIDDAKYKHKQMMFGVKVLGNCKAIRQVVSEHRVNEIIIAMPSVSGSVVREIIQECKATKCILKIVPGIYELIDGKVTVQQLRNVDVEDLLRRDSVQLDIDQIAGYLSGKRVLVTGAGGSIGSELCRQIAQMAPGSLILLGKGENSIYEIDRELRDKHPDLVLQPVVADIRDEDRINCIFSELKPQVVFHAAAHKHVPLMEAQPIEAVRNNIFGTKIVAEAANRFKIEIFVMISTDKAVNPTSVMGATKRVAELIIQDINLVSSTKYVAVRFGNVLGSRGSVIPLFKKQIAQGGPVTITHPDMVRYFMTIPEASQLVLQAGALATGGEVFVLDMGEPVKIVDMACDLIELSGLTPYKDIKIEFTGLRPGEKLFEELLTDEEGTLATRNKKIFCANIHPMNEQVLRKALLELKEVIDSKDIMRTLEQLLPSYQKAKKKYCLRSIGDVKTSQTTKEKYNEFASNY